jgi:uncharacterized protein (TIGR01370 family)
LHQSGSGFIRKISDQAKALFWLLLCLGSVFWVGCAAASAEPPVDIAFYYGDEAPVGSLMAYDWAVLQNNLTSGARLDRLKQAGVTPITYVSVGEMARSHQLFAELQSDWRIGNNPAWDSVVLDVRNPAVRRFILDRLIEPAMARGFQGVFLDTLDSFELVVEKQPEREAFAKAQQRLIEQIRGRYPQAEIILNRGFHLPSPVMEQVDALAFESWRSGYDASEERYYEVPEADREWLEGQIERWREARPDMPVIAIDYTEDGGRASELAGALREEGFVPWVGNADLTRLSPAKPEQVSRHVLVVHDLAKQNMDRSAAHRFSGVVLERLGFVPHYHSTQQPLPSEPTSDRYAGILVWLERGERNTSLCAWLRRQQNRELPVVMMGDVPTDPVCRGVLEAADASVPQAPIANERHHHSVGKYEGRRLPVMTEQTLPVAPQAEAWLTLTDDSGDRFSPVYTHQQGGVAAAPFIFEPGPEAVKLWLFDPFAFLGEALGEPDWPVIDPTTEGGRRVVTTHIDGDAFISKGEFPGSPLSATVLRNEILERYSLPHTVSVVEAEVSPDGLYPELSAQAERIARDIFRMDNVEVASHTYSHPFFWRPMEGAAAPRLDDTLYGYSLDIPGYTLSLEREIGGSISYVNERLAPADKPASVYLWSGDARPGPEALRRVRESGLYNVNGGNTHPQPYGSELALTWPDARPVGDELQVYAPVMNENVFTGEWTGPFYGYRNVIDTFRLLEDKGRLKPMGIYYHFYSATKPEALSALREVYDYALSQPITPLYLSDYARRVQARYYSALLRDGDGGWHWRGIGQPHTVKIARDRFPDLGQSLGVAGYHDAAGNRYVHLVGGAPRLILGQEPPSGPYIEQANGVITGWQRERDGDRWRVSLALQSHASSPLLTLAGVTQCRLIQGNAEVTRREDSVQLKGAQKQKLALKLECRQAS